MIVECADNRLDLYVERRAAWITSVLLRDITEALKWHISLRDDLKPNICLQCDSKSKEFWLDRQWAAQFWREKRMHLVEADLAWELCCMLCGGENSDVAACKLAEKAADVAETAGEEELVAELRYRVYCKREELEWLRDIEPEVDSAMNCAGWNVDAGDDDEQRHEVAPYLRTLLERVRNEYARLETKLAAVRSSSGSRKTAILMRSISRYLKAATALNDALIALADQKTIRDSVPALDRTAATWNRAWHLSRVITSNVRNGSIADEVVLAVAEDALQLGLDVSDVFLAKRSEVVDPVTVRRFSNRLDVPVEWIVKGQFRSFWQ
jgi:hypothetical protein